MQIRDVMTSNVDTMMAGDSIDKAARRMKQLDTGFMPVTDSEGKKLVGVATDRDIVVRCVAEGLDPASTPIEKAMTDKVLYCFADDDVESAAGSMAKQQVFRLVVLDGRESKRLVGVVTIGDIRRHGANEVAEEAAERVLEAA